MGKDVIIIVQTSNYQVQQKVFTTTKQSAFPPIMHIVYTQETTEKQHKLKQKIIKKRTGLGLADDVHAQHSLRNALVLHCKSSHINGRHIV